MKILQTFEMFVNIKLNPDQTKEGLEKLNIFYTGDSEANVLVNGKYVAKYPEIEKNNPNFINSHYAIHRSYRKKIKVDLMEDGTIQISKKTPCII